MLGNYFYTPPKKEKKQKASGSWPFFCHIQTRWFFGHQQFITWICHVFYRWFSSRLHLGMNHRGVTIIGPSSGLRLFDLHLRSHNVGWGTQLSGPTATEAGKLYGDKWRVFDPNMFGAFFWENIFVGGECAMTEKVWLLWLEVAVIYEKDFCLRRFDRKKTTQHGELQIDSGMKT